MSPTRRTHLAAPAALAVALAAAAYLVWYGEPLQDMALTRPSTDLSLALEATMPTIRSIGSVISSRLRELVERWSRTPGEPLRGLDERALADIGVHPSEIDSIETESQGRSDVTHPRIVIGLCRPERQSLGL